MANSSQTQSSNWKCCKYQY